MDNSLNLGNIEEMPREYQASALLAYGSMLARSVGDLTLDLQLQALERVLLLYPEEGEVRERANSIRENIVKHAEEAARLAHEITEDFRAMPQDNIRTVEDGFALEKKLNSVTSRRSQPLDEETLRHVISIMEDGYDEDDEDGTLIEDM